MKKLMTVAVSTLCAAVVFSSFADDEIETPEGYERVGYVYGDGWYARFVTDFTPVPKTDQIEATVTMTDGTRDQAIWCTRSSNNSYSWSVFYIANVEKHVRFDYYNLTSGTVGDVQPGTKFTVTVTNTQATIGADLHKYADVSGFSTCQGPVMIGSSYSGSTTDAYNSNTGYYSAPGAVGSFRLHGFKIWRSGVLVRDYIPVCRTATGEGLLYDAVNRALLEPVGRFLTGGPFAVVAIPDQPHTGSAVHPEPKVYDADSGEELSAGADFDYDYLDATEVGDKAFVIIRGRTGAAHAGETVRVPFRIIGTDYVSVNAELAAARTAKTLSNGDRVKSGLYFSDAAINYLESQGDTARQVTSAFDGNYSTLFNLCSSGWTESIGLALPYLYRAGERIVVKRYKVASGNAEGVTCSWRINAWTLQGSDNPYDEASWETIDVQNNPHIEVGSYAQTTVDIPGNTKAYRAYRLYNVPSHPSNWWLGFREIELFAECSAYPNGVRFTPVSYTADYDAQAHSAGVTLVEPAGGIDVTYAESEEGPYSATPPAFSEVGTHYTYMKLDGGATYGQHAAVAAVNIRPKPVDASWIAAIEDQPYTGSGVEPALTVVDPGSRALTLGADYTVAYKDNVDCGTATATITGINSYKGSASATFTIVPSFQPVDHKIYVDPVNGDDSSMTGDPDHPLRSFETAIFGAREGDTIHLLAGRHRLARAAEFVNRRNISVVGAGAATTFIEPADGVKDRLLTISGCENLVFRDLALANANLENTTPIPLCGGAVYASGSTGLAFLNCVFDGNTVCEKTPANWQDNTWGYGGAVYVTGTSVGFTDCTFENNVATQSNPNKWTGHGSNGGALYATKSAVGATNCVFRFNRSLNYDGYHGNSADCNGAAVCMRSPTVPATFVNCLFWRNRDLPRTGTHGRSTVHLAGSGTTVGMRLENCTVADNCTYYGVYAEAGKVEAVDTVVERHQKDTQGTVVFSTTDGVTPGASVGLPAGAPSVWYVAATAAASDENAGTEEAPFRTLTRALAAAADGDEIRVAAGLYTPAAGETLPIDLTDRYDLRIVGAGKGVSVVDADGSAAQLVRIVRGQRIVLSGFTFRNAATTETAAAGLSSYDSADVTVRGCAFSGCTYAPSSKSLAATTYNGVVMLNRVFLHTLENCDVTGNTADFTSAANTHTMQGLAYCGNVALAEIRNCSFFGNTAKGNVNVRDIAVSQDQQGTMFTSWSNFRNCLIAGNASAGVTGSRYSVLLQQTAGISLENCTVVGDGGNGLGAPVNDVYFGYFTVRNTIVTGHDDELVNFGDDVSAKNYIAFETNLVSAATDDYPTKKINKHTPVSGTLLGDAGFEGPADRPLGYRVVPSSPAINAGAVLPWMDKSSTDLAGQRRISRRKPDIGCYELVPGLMLLVR